MALGLLRSCGDLQNPVNEYSQLRLAEDRPRSVKSEAVSFADSDWTSPRGIRLTAPFALAYHAVRMNSGPRPGLGPERNGL